MSASRISSIAAAHLPGRAAPVLHFLMPVDAEIEERLRETALRCHEERLTCEDVIERLTAQAVALGYSTAIAAQQVPRTMRSPLGDDNVQAPVLLLYLRPQRPRSGAPLRSAL